MADGSLLALERQRWVCTTWPTFSYTLSLLFIITTAKSAIPACFLHKNCFELFLSAHFLFSEFVDLNLAFAVCRKRDSTERLSIMYTSNGKNEFVPRDQVPP